MTEPKSARSSRDESGHRHAGRIVLFAEGIGLLAVVLAFVALITARGDGRWLAAAPFLLIATLAYGMLANAILRH